MPNTVPDQQPALASNRVHVAAGIIVNSYGEILLAKRPDHTHQGGLWEFPGGKVERDENPEEALRREIKEELGVDLCDSCLQPFTFVCHAYEEFHLSMFLFLCRRWEGVPQGKEGQNLKWVRVAEMKDYPMPPADVPLVAALRDASL